MLLVTVVDVSSLNMLIHCVLPHRLFTVGGGEVLIMRKLIINRKAETNITINKDLDREDLVIWGQGEHSLL